MKTNFLIALLFIIVPSANLFAQNNPNFYLHENGVTCMCPNAAIGETGTVNGVVYTKRTREEITNENASTTCTSGITDMSYMFSVKSFNQPIGNWDTSNVTNMSGMFSYNEVFNQPIGNWDVSNVIDMSRMFVGTYFNQPIGSWNVGKVTDMRSMFYSAFIFNQPLDSWDVSEVKEMSAMFYAAYNFNRPIGSWNVGNVTEMIDMFYYAKRFNQPINSWCVKLITAEPRGFSLNSPLSIDKKPNWGTCSTLSNEEFNRLNVNTDVYPNPFTADVKINLPENVAIQQVEVINSLGQTVYISNETELNLEHLSAGMYFVKVNTNQGSVTEKIIKN